ncbi:cysteine proteinase, partial [Backusella circina FSU 941]
MVVKKRGKRKIIMDSDEEDEYTQNELEVIEINSDVEEIGQQDDPDSIWDFPAVPPLPPSVQRRYPQRKRLSHFSKLREERSFREEGEEGEEEEHLITTPTAINDLFQSDDLLIYPYSGKNAVSLRKRDLQRLEEDELLNDALIDIYPKILEEETYPEANIHTFSSLFYTRLIAKSKTKRGGRITIDHNSVKRWTNNHDLFSKTCLIIPIEQRNHWYLVVVMRPSYCIKEPSNEEDKEEDQSEEKKKTHILDDESEEKKSDTMEDNENQNVKDKKDQSQMKRSYIAILDPLGKKHAATYRSICEYLKEEAIEKLQITDDRFIVPDLILSDCPHQTNFSDCGIFCLHFIKQFYENSVKMMNALISQRVETVTDEHWSKEDIPQLR